MQAKTANPSSDNSLSQKAYHHIRRRVFNGELPPGSRLVNRTLAAEVGSSFIPVREAINRLASEGIVDQVAGAGAFVRRFDRQEVSEIYDVRELIEPFAAAQAARLMNSHELEELGAVMQDWEALGERVMGRKRGATVADLDHWLQLNQRFHEVIIAASRNRFLAKVVNEVHVLSRCFAAHRGSPRLLSKELIDSTLKSHRLLLDAFAKRAGEEAERIVRLQLGYGRQTVLKFFDSVPAT